ncbi:MAG: hypothetical protein MIO93_08890, partial [ANME-2 cluster archaeon]|nr:hypothetical protein [ANME-2 cluster archaeon]
MLIGQKKQAFDCDECHTVSDLGGSPGAGHAARLVDCAICHNKTLFESAGRAGRPYMKWAHSPGPGNPTSGLMFEYGMKCNDCHRTEGGKSNKANMFLDDVYENIIHEGAAHVGFYNNADNDTTLLGGSESCVGCHTHVEFNFTQPLGTSDM